MFSMLIVCPRPTCGQLCSGSRIDKSYIALGYTVGIHKESGYLLVIRYSSGGDTYLKKC